MFKHLPLLLLLSLCGVSQSAVNTITVTAQRNIAAQPDQVAFNVAVNAPLTATRDDVLAALAGSGIGLANFSSVYTSYQSIGAGPSTQVLQWSFTVTAPISALKDEIGLLNGLQQSIGKNGFSLSYNISGLQTSAQAQQAQTCSQADLISDARAQAQTIAAAASMRVMSIVSMASAVSTATPPSCSLTVKFALGAAI